MLFFVITIPQTRKSRLHSLPGFKPRQNNSRGFLLNHSYSPSETTLANLTRLFSKLQSVSSQHFQGLHFALMISFTVIQYLDSSNRCHGSPALSSRPWCHPVLLKLRDHIPLCLPPSNEARPIHTAGILGRRDTFKLFGHIHFFKLHTFYKP